MCGTIYTLYVSPPDQILTVQGQTVDSLNLPSLASNKGLSTCTLYMWLRAIFSARAYIMSSIINIAQHRCAALNFIGNRAKRQAQKTEIKHTCTHKYKQIHKFNSYERLSVSCICKDVKPELFPHTAATRQGLIVREQSTLDLKVRPWRGDK